MKLREQIKLATSSKLYFKIWLGFLILAFIPLAVTWFLVNMQVRDVKTATVSEIRSCGHSLLERSQTLLKDQARELVRQKAYDSAAQIETFLTQRLGAHKYTEEDLLNLINDPQFSKIAVQGIGKFGYTAVHTKKGICIAHPYPQMLGKDLKELSAKLPDFWELINRGFNEEAWGEYKWFDKQGNLLKKVMYLKPLDRYDLVVAATATLDEFLSPATRLRKTVNDVLTSTEDRIAKMLSTFHYEMLILIAVLIIAAMLLTGYISRNIIIPLHELTAAMKQAPDISTQTIKSAERKDEIGVLARVFIDTQKRIKEYQENLLASQHKLKELNEQLERKARERTKELQKAVAKLETLDRSKDEFIWLVSHELKTPLTSIANCSELLLTEGFTRSPEEQKKYLEIIGEEVQRLDRLIDDVLVITRMEAGKLPFNLQNVDILSLVERAVIQHQPVARKRGLNLKFKAEPTPELLSVKADPDRIKQVLSNLISNAIKFTPAGGEITVSVKTKTVNGNKSALVSVSDTGVGIPRSEWESIFEKFTQLEQVEHHSVGSGLGLPIAKKIVEIHNGRIWLESEEGRGTTFYFTVPI